ncbi:MAG: anti-sigma factor family protein [Actinomycetota bacterium]
MITCSDAVKQLWEYLDGSVEASQREAIEEHLSVCRRCCGEVEFAEELRKFLTDHSSQDLPEDVRARLVGYLQGL